MLPRSFSPPTVHFAIHTFIARAVQECRFRLRQIALGEGCDRIIFLVIT
jgi:hypothetical protein